MPRSFLTLPPRSAVCFLPPLNHGDCKLGPRPILPPQILMDGPVGTTHLHQLLDQITPHLPLIKDGTAGNGDSYLFALGNEQDEGTTDPDGNPAPSLQAQLIDAVKALR